MTDVVERVVMRHATWRVLALFGLGFYVDPLYRAPLRRAAVD